MSDTWKTLSYPAACSDDIPEPSMSFEPIEFEDNIKEEYDKQGRRWYVQGSTRMASITTILKETDREGQLALAAWRDRVGIDKAEWITNTAAALGTRWHNLAEHYVQKSDVNPFITQPGDRYRAAALGFMLNHQIKRVVASECRVASPEIRAAGRMDMVVELHNGKLAVLDFKTGTKAKVGNRLQNYGIQASFYAKVVGDMIGQPIDTIIIAQLNEHHYLWQTNKTRAFLPLLTERVNDFYRREEL